MPADKYSKSLYKAGTMKSEKAAIANRDPARKAAAMKIMAREGTTSAAGGRPAAKVAMPKPVQKPVQVTRTTTAYRPTPMGKKK
jgi:hypothetical protein